MNHFESEGRSAGWLYRYEARGIQSYVTATERLEEVAGASALVEALKEDGTKLAKELGGDVMTDAAGSATIHFNDRESCEHFAQWWPMVAERVAPGLPMVQSAVDLSAHDRPLAALRVELDAAYQRRYPDLPEAGPLMHRSGRTGLPAVTRGDRPGKRDMRDLATERKVRALKHPQESGQVIRLDDGLGRRFLGGATTRRPLLSRNEDFGDGYIAVVHIDGNDMGERILSLPLDRYSPFAKGLAKAVEAAAQAATAELIQRDELRRDAQRRNGAIRDDSPIPARPVVLGGDDCTILTLAEDAIPFAITFLKVLEDRGQQPPFSAQGLQATAGIAFIKPRAPFSHGLRLANELCSYAKDCLRRTGEKGHTPSSLLFHRVTTGVFAGWDSIRHQELAAAPPDRSAMQPGAFIYGPYRLHGERSIDQLDALVTEVKALPTGPLREWLRVARTDPNRARLRWRRLRDVTSGREQSDWERCSQALKDLDVEPENGWGTALSREPGMATPLHDALTWSVVATPLPSAVPKEANGE